MRWKFHLILDNLKIISIESWVRAFYSVIINNNLVISVLLLIADWFSVFDRDGISSFTPPVSQQARSACHRLDINFDLEANINTTTTAIAATHWQNGYHSSAQRQPTWVVINYILNSYVYNFAIPNDNATWAVTLVLCAQLHSCTTQTGWEGRFQSRRMMRHCAMCFIIESVCVCERVRIGTKINIRRWALANKPWTVIPSWTEKGKVRLGNYATKHLIVQCRWWSHDGGKYWIGLLSTVIGCCIMCNGHCVLHTLFESWYGYIWAGYHFDSVYEYIVCLNRHTNTHIKCGSTGCVDRVVIDEHKQAKYLVIITMYAMRVCLVAANNTGSGQVLCQAIRTSTKTVQDNDYYRNTATFRHLMCVYTTRLKLSHLNCNLYQDDTPRTHARAINYI